MKANDKVSERTNRDDIAIKAMQGILSANHSVYWGNIEGCPFPGGVAKDAYALADAMIEESESKV